MGAGLVLEFVLENSPHDDADATSGYSAFVHRFHRT